MISAEQIPRLTALLLLLYSSNANLCDRMKCTLQDYLSNPVNTQTKLAKDVGVTQGAINQMLTSGRTIYVIISGEHIALEEVRQLGNSAA